MKKKLLIPGLVLGLLAASITPVVPASFTYAAVAPVVITSSAATYTTGSQVSVTGNAPVGKDITFKMLDSSGLLINVDVLYGKDNNGQFNFNFTLPAGKTGAMTIVVGYGGGSGEFAIKNVTVSNPTPPGGGGGGGGFPPVTQPTTPSTTGSVDLGKVITESTANGTVTVTFDTAKLAELMTSTATPDTGMFVLDVKGTGIVKAEVTAKVLELLSSKNKDAVLQVKTSLGTYNIPVQQLDLAKLAQEQGISDKDAKLVIIIQKPQDNQTAALNTAASNQDLDVIASAVDFAIVLVLSDGTIKPITSFSKYLERTIPLPSTVNPATAAGVIFNEETGEFSPVPSVFNGLTATMYRKGNSIYTVIDNPKTFADISTHWAKADIELLASKMIVNGVADNKFAPDQSISRAEFAALLARSLAVDKVNAKGFSDVASSDWFSGAVGAAQDAQLISGFEDGTFKPNASITREQMVTMIVRALQYAGKEVASNPTVIDKFTDRAAISDWSKEAVAQSITAGVIQGMTDTTFAPQENATRAQGTLMLERMLQYLKFINK